MSITRVQYVSNASTGSGTTSLSTTIAAATAGNLLIALISTGSTATNGTTTTPSGFTLAVGPITNTSASPPPVNLYLFYKIATGGETSVVATNTVVSGVTCQVWEFSASGGWPANPVDVSASSANQAATTTPVTGTTATTAQGEELWIGGLSTNSGTQITFSLPTNSFTLEAAAWAGASAFFSPNTAGLYKIVAATGAANSGATSSISKGFGGLVVAFKDNAATTVNGIAQTIGAGSQTAVATLATPANSLGQGSQTAVATLATAAQSVGQGQQTASATLADTAQSLGMGSAVATVTLAEIAQASGQGSAPAAGMLVQPAGAVAAGQGSATMTAPAPPALPIPVARSIAVAATVTARSITTSGPTARSVTVAAATVTAKSVTVGS